MQPQPRLLLAETQSWGKRLGAGGSQRERGRANGGGGGGETRGRAREAERIKWTGPSQKEGARPTETERQGETESGRGAEMEQIRGLRARAPENLGQRKQRRGQRCGKLRD